MFLLNETHLQIEFILEESGFLDLQRKGFHWKLHCNEKLYPVVLHPFIPFIIGDTEGHDCLCKHHAARFSAIKQLFVSVSVPHIYLVTSEQSFATGSPLSSID